MGAAQAAHFLRAQFSTTFVLSSNLRELAHACLTRRMASGFSCPRLSCPLREFDVERVAVGKAKARALDFCS
jgi:hypothetical protein